MTMTQKSYAQIQKQIEALQKQAEKLKAEEVAGVIARIKDAIAHYGLTAEQLGYGGISRGAKAKAKKVTDSNATTYSDGAGNSWGGRGPRPQWLKAAIAAGRSLEELASSGSLPATRAKATKKKATKATVKKRVATTYRDEAGNKWSGFGPRPRWLKEALETGKTLEQLAG